VVFNPFHHFLINSAVILKGLWRLNVCLRMGGLFAFAGDSVVELLSSLNLISLVLLLLDFHFFDHLLILLLWNILKLVFLRFFREGRGD